MATTLMGRPPCIICKFVAAPKRESQPLALQQAMALEISGSEISVCWRSRVWCQLKRPISEEDLSIDQAVYMKVVIRREHVSEVERADAMKWCLLTVVYLATPSCSLAQGALS